MLIYAVASNSVQVAAAHQIKSLVPFSLEVIVLHDDMDLKSDSDNASPLTFFLCIVRLVTRQFHRRWSKKRLPNDSRGMFQLGVNASELRILARRKWFGKEIVPSWAISLCDFLERNPRPSFAIIFDDSALSSSAVIQACMKCYEIPVVFVQTYSRVQEEFEMRYLTAKRFIQFSPLVPIIYFIRLLNGSVLKGDSPSVFRTSTFPLLPWLRATLLGFGTNQPFVGYLGHCSAYLFDDEQDLNVALGQIKEPETPVVRFKNIVLSSIDEFPLGKEGDVVLVVVPKIDLFDLPSCERFGNLLNQIEKVCQIYQVPIVLAKHPNSSFVDRYSKFLVVSSIQEALARFNVRVSVICNSSTFRIFESACVPIINFDFQTYSYVNVFGGRERHQHFYLSDLRDVGVQLRTILEQNRSTTFRDHLELPDIAEVFSKLSL
jgi:hypothetical protein